MQPGVYMHKDKTGRVIYVGKAKLLRNRVANYFQPPERLNAKTRQLVSHIDTFDIIVTESEFEALVLENSMIKKYQPKYNILLKDDKGYPYIRLDTTQDYPRFTVVSRPAEDGARYFGPYMGRKAAFSAIDTISEALHLATCSRVFPRDIGKDRPCLNQHLGRCCAPCTGRVSAEEYRALILQAASIFEGGAKQLERELTEKMNEAANERPTFATVCAPSRSSARGSMWSPGRSPSWTRSRSCRDRPGRACACCITAAARCKARNTRCST